MLAAGDSVQIGLDSGVEVVDDACHRSLRVDEDNPVVNQRRKRFVGFSEAAQESDVIKLFGFSSRGEPFQRGSWLEIEYEMNGSFFNEPHANEPSTPVEEIVDRQSLSGLVGYGSKFVTIRDYADSMFQPLSARK